MAILVINIGISLRLIAQLDSIARHSFATQNKTDTPLDQFRMNEHSFAQTILTDKRGDGDGTKDRPW